MCLKKKFEERFGEDYTISKCKDKGCSLKDISKENYLILNGDEIKASNEKSVDCIIIDLRANKNKKFRIILCELTKGSKEINNALLKFKNSGKLIINYMDEINESVYKIDCLLLGKITKNGKVIDKKQLLNKFKIEGFNKSLIIQNEKCNFSIEEMEI